MIIETFYLKKYLSQHYLSKIYIIIEKENLFLQENTKIILKYLKRNKFIHKIKIIVHNDSEFTQIIQLCQKKEIFFKKLIIIAIIKDKKLSLQAKLFFKNKNFLDQDIICIFQYPNLIFNIKYELFFYKNIKNKVVILKNSIFNIKNIHTWITNKIKEYKLHITENIIKNIISKYKYNLNKINNTLKIFSLLYPNTKITSSILEYHYNNFETKESYHWINSVIHKKKNISIHILKKLKIQKYNITTLLRHYKNFIFIILKIKEKKITEKNYNPKEICNYPIKFNLLNILANKNSLIKIYQAIKILKYIDFIIINYKKETIWIYLKILSILFN
nr:hypothetical protein [Buchnera aphidicola]